jgi:hypothetical protein
LTRTLLEVLLPVLLAALIASMMPLSVIVAAMLVTLIDHRRWPSSLAKVQTRALLLPISPPL